MAGALEADESIGDALVREVREETGLSVRSVELFGVFSDPSRIVGYDDGNVYRVVAIAFRGRGVGRLCRRECGVTRAAVRLS